MSAYGSIARFVQDAYVLPAVQRGNEQVRVHVFGPWRGLDGAFSLGEIPEVVGSERFRDSLLLASVPRKGPLWHLPIPSFPKSLAFGKLDTQRPAGATGKSIDRIPCAEKPRGLACGNCKPLGNLNPLSQIEGGRVEEEELAAAGPTRPGHMQPSGNTVDYTGYAISNQHFSPHKQGMYLIVLHLFADYSRNIGSPEKRELEDLGE